MISPYSGADQLLGAFRSREDARRARREYIETLGRGDKADPWKAQVYKTVNLNADLRIVDNIPSTGVTDAPRRVFVVSKFSDQFGQLFREFKIIRGTAIDVPTSINPVIEAVDIGRLIYPIPRVMSRGLRKEKRRPPN